MRVVPCFVVAAVLSSCSTDFGTCDMTAAKSVVYSADGTPYYVGQGMVQYSCSNGVCHSSGAVNDGRGGAPHGLDFDLRPLGATTTADSVTALVNGVDKVRDVAGTIYGEVLAETMPPGAAGERQAPQWKRADGSAVEMPSVISDVGKSTVRNWLACGAPVVAAAVATGQTPPADVARISGGDVVAPLASSGGADFASVYAVFSDRCVTCHSPAGGNMGNLNLGDAQTAFDALVGKPASSGTCSGKLLVEAGKPDASALYLKLTPQFCGPARMPLIPPYYDDAMLKMVSDWITAGAKR